MSLDSQNTLATTGAIVSLSWSSHWSSCAFFISQVAWQKKNLAPLRIFRESFAYERAMSGAVYLEMLTVAPATMPASSPWHSFNASTESRYTFASGRPSPLAMQKSLSFLESASRRSDFASTGVRPFPESIRTTGPGKFSAMAA